MFLLFVFACFEGCASIPDDEDPVLATRSGERAKVVIDDSAFSRGGGGSYGYTVTTSDGEQRSAMVQVHTQGFTWGAGEARKLEQYFTDALVQSGGFVVIDRSVLADRRAEEANGDLLETEDRLAGTSRVLRPDLKLRCQLVDLNPRAESKSGRGRGAIGWLSAVFGWIAGWFGGGTSESAHKATCEIRVAIVDCHTGATIATAKGEGYSVGTSRRSQGSAWGIGGLGIGGFSLGSGERKDANLSVAIERATVRAVNDLMRQIPARYFRHQL